MRRVLPLTVLLLASAIASAQVVSDAEKKEGFKPLFNGKTFEGWKTSEKTEKSWKIEEGMLVLLGGGISLYTKDDYTDFVLRFEWRAKKKSYDSGLFLRGNNQIQMARGQEGLFFANTKDTKAVPKLHKEPGEWNEWEVTCIGPKVIFKVNGKLAWEIDNFKAKSGPIGLQAEGSPFDFKNLRIKVIEKKS